MRARRRRSQVAPFDAAVVVLVLTAAIVAASWPENFGGQSHDGVVDRLGAAVVTICSGACERAGGVAHRGEAQSRASLDAMLATCRCVWRAAADRRIFLLGALQAMYEGVLYTFVFLWTPSLSSQGEKVRGGHARVRHAHSYGVRLLKPALTEFAVLSALRGESLCRVQVRLVRPVACCCDGRRCRTAWCFPASWRPAWWAVRWRGACWRTCAHSSTWPGSTSPLWRPWPCPLPSTACPDGGTTTVNAFRAGQAGAHCSSALQLSVARSGNPAGRCFAAFPSLHAASHASSAPPPRASLREDTLPVAPEQGLGLTGYAQVRALASTQGSPASWSCRTSAQRSQWCARVL